MKILIYIILSCLILLLLLAGLDREIARRDYIAGNKVENCIFKTNCNYYNNLLKGK